MTSSWPTTPRQKAKPPSTGDMLAFIDSDCQAEPAWLVEGDAALDQWDFVGGQVKVLVQTPVRPTPTEALEPVLGRALRATRGPSRFPQWGCEERRRLKAMDRFTPAP